MPYHYINNLYFTGRFYFLARLLFAERTKSSLHSDWQRRPFCSA